MACKFDANDAELQQCIEPSSQSTSKRACFSAHICWPRGWQHVGGRVRVDQSLDQIVIADEHEELEH